MVKEKLKYRPNKKTKAKKYLPEEIDHILFTVTYKEKVDRKKIEKTRIEKHVPIFMNKKQTKLGFYELVVDDDLNCWAGTLVQSGGGWNGVANTPGGVLTYRPDYMGTHNKVMFLKEEKNLKYLTK